MKGTRVIINNLWKEIFILKEEINELKKDPYSKMSVEEMRKSTKKDNYEKAVSLGLKVYRSWSEKRICEAIFNYYNH